MRLKTPVRHVWKLIVHDASDTWRVEGEAVASSIFCGQRGNENAYPYQREKHERSSDESQRLLSLADELEFYRFKFFHLIHRLAQ